MALDRDIGLAGIHARAAARDPADFVAHRVLNFKSHELETGKRTFDCGNIDPDGASRIKPIGPRQGVSGSIDIVFVAVTAGCRLPENAAGDPAFKIDPVGEPKITAELDATTHDINLFRVELLQLFGQKQLETAGTGSKESFHRRFLFKPFKSLVVPGSI